MNESVKSYETLGSCRLVAKMNKSRTDRSIGLIAKKKKNRRAKKLKRARR